VMGGPPRSCREVGGVEGQRLADPTDKRVVVGDRRPSVLVSRGGGWWWVIGGPLCSQGEAILKSPRLDDRCTTTNTPGSLEEPRGVDGAPACAFVGGRRVVVGDSQPMAVGWWWVTALIEDGGG